MSDAPLTLTTLDSWWTIATPRERDAAVAEHVMGYEVRYVAPESHYVRDTPAEYFDVIWNEPVPQYTADIADAWYVVKAMRARGLNAHVSELDRGSIVQFNPPGGLKNWQDAVCPTTPEAICLGALRAVLWMREAKEKGESHA